MTDKQIIIDGCDVSGCEFLDNVEYDKLCLMISHRNECQVNCSNKPNCYYKQLKRKEQECEEIRNKLNSNIERMNEQNEKLHNENKELKSYIKEDLVPHTKTKLFKKH